MGYNYRMTDLQGAVGIVQLKKLDTLIDERQKWADYYLEKLKDIDWLQLPSSPVDYRHGWQSFVTLVKEEIAPLPRNKIMERLQAVGISTRPWHSRRSHAGFLFGKNEFVSPQFPWRTAGQ